jgi:hypothetical protein
VSAPLIQPEPPDPLVAETRTFWREIGREMLKGTIATIDETAKQIVGVAGVLAGLYVNAVAFSDLRQGIATGVQLVYVTPLGLLFVSLVAALIVFWPDRSRLNLNSFEAAKHLFERTARDKLLALRIASVFLGLGVLTIGIAVWVYLTTFTTPPGG